MVQNTINLLGKNATYGQNGRMQHVFNWTMLLSAGSGLLDGLCVIHVSLFVCKVAVREVDLKKPKVCYL